MNEWCENREVDLNLAVTAVLQCAACPARVFARAKSFESGIDLALAGGWAVVNRKREIVVCPRHNPARMEFSGYRMPKERHDAILTQ